MAIRKEIKHSLLAHVRIKREHEESTLAFAKAAERAGQCSICFEDLRVGGERALAQTACQHIFCATCIDDWRGNGKGDRDTCPMCRGPIEHDLFSEARPLKRARLQTNRLASHDYSP